MDLPCNEKHPVHQADKAPVQQREFNFRRIPNTTLETFHVDVSDEKMNRYMFRIQKEGSSWKIADNSLPVWINEVEPKLNEIMETEPLLKKLGDSTIDE